MKMNFLIFFAVLFALPVSGQEKSLNEKDLTELKKLMTGFFSTEAQSLEDTSYFHIRLCMKPIWQDRQDGYWLYVEQAAYRSLNRPYRQRVYHLYLEMEKNALVSKVYEIENPGQFIGGCSDLFILSALGFESLIERPGCEILLKRESNNTFAGATEDGVCLSTWRGAAWVSSDVTVSPQGLTSWDRGWDEKNQLVWGPADAGYRFDRMEE